MWNEIARILSDRSKREYADHAAACLERNGAGKAHLVPFLRHVALNAMVHRIAWMGDRNEVYVLESAAHAAFVESKKHGIAFTVVEEVRRFCEEQLEAAKKEALNQEEGESK